MHEVSLMAQTLAIACDRAQTSGATQIHRLKVRVGTLSGVVPEALAFAFDVVAKETIAERAKLEIETVLARCYCDRCQCEFQPDDVIFICPNCQQPSSQILQGRDLELASIEVS